MDAGWTRVRVGHECGVDTSAEYRLLRGRGSGRGVAECAVYQTSCDFGLVTFGLVTWNGRVRGAAHPRYLSRLQITKQISGQVSDFRFHSALADIELELQPAYERNA